MATNQARSLLGRRVDYEGITGFPISVQEADQAPLISVGGSVHIMTGNTEIDPFICYMNLVKLLEGIGLFGDLLPIMAQPAQRIGFDSGVPFRVADAMGTLEKATVG
jgi:hypothetical protein